MREVASGVNDHENPALVLRATLYAIPWPGSLGGEIYVLLKEGGDAIWNNTKMDPDEFCSDLRVYGDGMVDGYLDDVFAYEDGEDDDGDEENDGEEPEDVRADIRRSAEPTTSKH